MSNIGLTAHFELKFFIFHFKRASMKQNNNIESNIKIYCNKYIVRFNFIFVVRMLDLSSL